MAEQRTNISTPEKFPTEKGGMKVISFSDQDRSKIHDCWTKAPSPVWEEFARRHGQLLRFLYIHVHKWDVIALLDHWQPALCVFTFKDMDLTPTLEEYAQILGWPISQEDLIYTKTRTEISYGHLADLLCTTLPGKQEGIHSSFLIKHLQKCCTEKRWDAFMATTAILVYGLLLFPSRPQWIDEVSLSIYLEVEKKQVNPVPAILAETFMQLSICKANYGFSFRASATMLFIWISLHLYVHKRGTIELTNPLAFAEEICDILPQFATPEQRKTHYANLRSYDIKWKILEGNKTSFIQTSGDLMCVPLIGIRGFTAYSPCLVMRQFGCKQPLPMLINMDKYRHMYTKEDHHDVNKRMRRAWKNNEVYTVSPPPSTETDSEYLSWFQERSKAIVKGKMPVIEASARSRSQLYDFERQIVALKGVISSKDNTIEDLNRQLVMRKDQSQKIAEMEIEKQRLHMSLAAEKQRHLLTKTECQAQIDDLQSRLKNRPKGVGAEMTRLNTEVWEGQYKIRELEQQNSLYKRERQTFLTIEMEMQEEINKLREQLRGKASAATSSKSRKIG